MFHFVGAIERDQQLHGVLDETRFFQTSRIDGPRAREHPDQLRGCCLGFRIIGANQHVAVDGFLEVRNQTGAQRVEGRGDSYTLGNVFRREKGGVLVRLQAYRGVHQNRAGAETGGKRLERADLRIRRYRQHDHAGLAHGPGILEPFHRSGAGLLRNESGGGLSAFGSSRADSHARPCPRKSKRQSRPFGAGSTNNCDRFPHFPDP